MVAERCAEIEPGKERSFAYGTALRLARANHRNAQRSHDELDEEALPDIEAPGIEDLLIGAKRDESWTCCSSRCLSSFASRRAVRDRGAFDQRDRSGARHPAWHRGITRTARARGLRSASPQASGAHVTSRNETMSELKRLRDQDSDRVARLLLDAGHFDDPPKKRLDRIVAGIAGAGVAVGVKTAAASSALAAAPIAAKSATLLALVFKWLGVGVLAGVVVSGGAATLQPDSVTTDAPSAVLPPPTAKGDPEGTRGSRRSFEPVQHERLGSPIEGRAPRNAMSRRRVRRSRPTPRAVQGVSPAAPERAAAPRESVLRRARWSSRRREPLPKCRAREPRARN